MPGFICTGPSDATDTVTIFLSGTGRPGTIANRAALTNVETNTDTARSCGIACLQALTTQCKYFQVIISSLLNYIYSLERLAGVSQRNLILLQL